MALMFFDYYYSGNLDLAHFYHFYSKITIAIIFTTLSGPHGILGAGLDHSQRISSPTTC